MSTVAFALAAEALAARGFMAFHYATPLTPPQVEFYGQFDLLVTHDPLPRAQVDSLHARGTRLLLYEWAVAFYQTRADAWQKSLAPSALLNAHPLRGHLGSPTADAYYYDPFHQDGRSRDLVARLRAIGYDGVFLDVTTSASVHPEAMAEYARRHPETPYDVAFARFLRELRHDVKLIATNQGYRAAEHVLPFVDVDVTESLITRPHDGKFALRPWNDPRDRWSSTAYLMRHLIAPAHRKFPRVRFVHLNYLDAPDAKSAARIVAIARRFGGEAYVTAPTLDAPGFFQ